MYVYECLPICFFFFFYLPVCLVQLYICVYLSVCKICVYLNRMKFYNYKYSLLWLLPSNNLSIKKYIKHLMLTMEIISLNVK